MYHEGMGLEALDWLQWQERLAKEAEERREQNRQNLAASAEADVRVLRWVGFYEYLTTQQIRRLFQLDNTVSAKNIVTRRLRRLAKRGLVQLLWERSLDPDALPPLWILTRQGAAAAGGSAIAFNPIRRIKERVRNEADTGFYYRFARDKHGQIKTEPRLPSLHTIQANDVAIGYRLGELSIGVPAGIEPSQLKIWGERQIMANPDYFAVGMGEDKTQLPDVYIQYGDGERDAVWVEVERSARAAPGLEKLARWWVCSGFENRASTLLLYVTGRDTGNVTKRLKAQIEADRYAGWKAATAAIQTVIDRR